MQSIFTPVVTAVVPSDLGALRLAASDAGVVAAELLGTDEAFVAGLAHRRFALVAVDDATPGPARDLATRAADALGAALAGEAVDLLAFPVDLRDRPGWDVLVLEGVRTIARGETASYGEVARRIGRPGAARAVGGAVGRNPVGLLVPCHRVIAGDGSIGGYGVAAWGGAEAAIALKRALLALEGVVIAR